jgi:hypothetical protein
VLCDCSVVTVTGVGEEGGVLVGSGIGVVEVSVGEEDEGGEEGREGGITIGADVGVDEEVGSPKLERTTVVTLASEAVENGVWVTVGVGVPAWTLVEALIPSTLSATLVSVHPTYTPIVSFIGVAKHSLLTAQTVMTKLPS